MVPTSSPEAVSWDSPPTRVRPKSARYARPDVSTRTLRGFTSRCTRPDACAASRALATWRRSPSAVAASRSLTAEARPGSAPRRAASRGRGRAPTRPPRARSRRLDGRASPAGVPRAGSGREGGIVRKLRVQDLQGKATLERELRRLVDNAHAAATDQSLDAVSGHDGSWLDHSLTSRMSEPTSSAAIDRLAHSPTSAARCPCRLVSGGSPPEVGRGTAVGARYSTRPGKVPAARSRRAPLRTDRGRLR